MSIFSDLANVLELSDEQSNKEIAKQISASKDKIAVKELIEKLKYKSKSIQSNNIKVLYEIGYLNPELLTDYMDEFLELLSSNNNRMVWGAMIALQTISSIHAEKFYKHLPQILNTADKGSVITRDAAFEILINVCKIPVHSEDVFQLVRKQLLAAPSNQLPMYAEKCMEIININNKADFTMVLSKRYAFLEKESQKKRIEKIRKKLAQI